MEADAFQDSAGSDENLSLALDQLDANLIIGSYIFVGLLFARGLALPPEDANDFSIGEPPEAAETYLPQAAFLLTRQHKLQFACLSTRGR